MQQLSRLLLRKYAAEVRLLTDALLADTRLTGNDVRDLLALVPLHEWPEPTCTAFPPWHQQR